MDRIFSRLKIARLTQLMLILNFIQILFISGIHLFAQKYAAISETSKDLLSALQNVPYPALPCFLAVNLLYVLLCVLFFCTSKKEGVVPLYMAELLICIFIGQGLYLEYNGYILLVICYAIQKIEKSDVQKLIGLGLLLYVLEQYSIGSVFFSVCDPAAFRSVFAGTISSSLYLIECILSSLNLLLFILSIVAFVADEQLHIDNISKELEMVNYVNAQLEDYVAITEKIGEDKERKRLAREIHDTLGHALTGIAAGVDACIALIDINPGATKKQLEVVSKVVRQGIGDVRASLNKLRPGALEQNGFKAAMESMIQEFMDVSSMTIHFDYQLQDFDFDNTKEDILFRIVQESITNALRHGLAKEVWISMYADGSSVILSVRDNGVGCKEVHMGYGLKQMSERVGMLGGKIFFNGDEGFLTIVNIPIKKGESL